MPVTLELFESGNWKRIGSGATDSDGRARNLTDARIAAGRYRLTFDTSAYLDAPFFPVVEIVFEVRDPSEHHHVPLLLSPFGYSTYRGS